MVLYYKKFACFKTEKAAVGIQSEYFARSVRGKLLGAITT